MFERVRETVERFLPTDGPGHTDYPEVDIRTHRNIAKWNFRIGIAAGVAGLYYGSKTGETWTMFAGLAFAALSFWSATQLRLEALEWEVELNDQYLQV
ncbi:hypothetical protein [Haloprofundus halobius]|uniref:hypothetical protein n=1 Tax=Haloprofundus halobius TaxID=2876194 RepID=UPI001CCF7D2D|nr:hypothetical protein [Haloprofundus halobius]